MRLGLKGFSAFRGFFDLFDRPHDFGNRTGLCNTSRVVDLEDMGKPCLAAEERFVCNVKICIAVTCACRSHNVVPMLVAVCLCYGLFLFLSQNVLN